MVRNVFICHTISLFYLLDIFAPVAALYVVYLLFIMLNWSGYCLFKQANGLCEWFSCVCVCVREWVYVWVCGQAKLKRLVLWSVIKRIYQIQILLTFTPTLTLTLTLTRTHWHSHWQLLNCNCPLSGEWHAEWRLQRWGQQRQVTGRVRRRRGGVAGRP